MMERNEFVEQVLYNFSEEDIKRFFGVTAEELENGAWNMALEYGYNECVCE